MGDGIRFSDGMRRVSFLTRERCSTVGCGTRRRAIRFLDEEHPSPDGRARMSERKLLYCPKCDGDVCPNVFP